MTPSLLRGASAAAALQARPALARACLDRGMQARQWACPLRRTTALLAYSPSRMSVQGTICIRNCFCTTLTTEKETATAAAEGGIAGGVPSHRVMPSDGAPAIASWSERLAQPEALVVELRDGRWLRFKPYVAPGSQLGSSRPVDIGTTVLCVLEKRDVTGVVIGILGSLTQPPISHHRRAVQLLMPQWLRPPPLHQRDRTIGDASPEGGRGALEVDWGALPWAKGKVIRPLAAGNRDDVAGYARMVALATRWGASAQRSLRQPRRLLNPRQMIRPPR